MSDTSAYQGLSVRLPGGLIIPIGTIAVGVLVVGFVLVPLILMATTPHYHGTLYDDPIFIEDIPLTRTDGKTFRISDYRGKLVIMYFGYTSCPDVCPTTLYTLRQVMEKLGDKASEVQVVFVTIDPENDTPERLREYLAFFNPSFVGVYGTQDELQPLLDQFDVRVLRADEGQTASGYSITHTTSMFVVNRSGYLRLRMHHGTQAEYLVRDLKYLLRERN